MKRAIVTRADASVAGHAAISHPIFKNLAKDWDADFIVIDETSPVKIFDSMPHFNIIRCQTLLKTYDRILVIDTDTIPTPKLDNLFDLVPETHIGSVLEDVGSRKADRREAIMRANKKFGELPTPWRTDYINTGVFVFSKEHTHIFDSVNGEYFTDWGSDDVHIGYQIKRFGFPIYELDPTYNFMNMFDEPWNGNPSRFEQKIVHYAGSPKKWGPTKEAAMKQDYDIIWQRS
jgi:lipopolysaccharide biosynthesis glycosyltransferase